MPSSEILEQARTIIETVGMLRMHMQRQFKAWDARECPDLTFSQANALHTVRHYGQMTVRDLAKALGVSPPSASTMVDRLVEMGMLTREQDPADRRQVRIGVAERGECGCASMESHMTSAIADMLEGLGPETSRKWVEVYRALQDWMTSHQTDAEDKETDAEAPGKES